ncbi:MAG: hypothetical protein LBP59_00360 [Planctomycetaceae bacterium]|jgi:hypothetical protein|nr:hypothetical protein [Planctomycetaceae bacterium]
MNILTNNFSSLFSKLSARYQTFVSANMKPVDSTVGLQKNSGDVAVQKSDALILLNKKTITLTNSTYIPPSIARRSRSENIHQEINKTVENTNAKNTQKELTTESIDDSTTKNNQEEITSNTKSTATVSSQDQKQNIKTVKTQSLGEQRAEMVKSKYGNGSLGGSLYFYDLMRHKTDIDKFITDKIKGQEKNIKQSSLENLSSKIEIDPQTEKEILTLEYWKYLEKNNKEFYDPSSKYEIPENLKDNEFVTYGFDQRNNTKYISFISPEHNYSPDNNSNTNDNQQQTNPSDAQSLISGLLKENNITLDNKEGFSITMQKDGTIEIKETNIKEQSKIETIKNLIATDESFQQEITNIFNTTTFLSPL